MGNKSKKSQVSFFLIIAAMLVLGAVLFYQYDDELTLFFESEQVNAVNDYLEACVQDGMRESVVLLANKGGWLYPPESAVVLADRSMFRDQIKDQVGFYYLDRQDLGYYYWYYYDDTDEAFKYNIPPYDSDEPTSVKSQLKRYVSEYYTSTCLPGLVAFEASTDISFDPESLEIIYTFDEDDIVTRIELPLIIQEKSNNQTSTLTVIEVGIDNDLTVPYYHAVDLVAAQAQSDFIEHRILGILNAYQSENDRSLLPPANVLALGAFDLKPWYMADVEPLVRNVVSSGLRYIFFENSDLRRYDQMPKSESALAQSIENLFKKDYLTEVSGVRQVRPDIFEGYVEHDVYVDFQPFFPLYVDVNPSLGPLIMPTATSQISEILPFFWTQYQFEYRLTGPVLVHIIRQSTTGEIEFIVPIEFNIQFNEPLRQNARVFVNDDEAFTGSEKTLLCDPNQFISQPVTFNITDPIRRSGVDEGVIMYTCKGKSCYIGQTQEGYIRERDRFSSQRIFVNKTFVGVQLPIDCDDGILKVIKENHKTLIIEDVSPSLDTVVDLGAQRMPSFVEVNVTLVKLNSNGFEEPLSPHDMLIVTFETPGTYARVGVFDQYNQSQIIELTEGNYSIEGMLMYNKSFDIPPEEICYNKYGFFGEECQDIPGVTIDQWLRGRVNIQDWRIRSADLRQSNQLVLYIKEDGLPKTFTDLEGSSFTGEGQTRRPQWTR